MAVQDKDKLVSLEDLKTAYDDLDGDVSDVKNTLNHKAYVIYDTASGDIASFPDGADGLPVKDLTVGIEPVQDTSGGDPSPTHICPISGWTGCNISHSGADTNDPAVIHISWQSSAGTVYGGTLDVTSGVLTVDRVCNTYDGSSDEQWSRYNAGSASSYCMQLLPSLALKPGTEGLMANYLQTITSDVTWGNYDQFISTGTTASGIFIGTGIRTVTTVEDWKTYLSNSPLQIAYKLATPLVIQLGPVTVTTLLGQNNIWADCGPSTVEYPCDTKLYIERLTAPEEDDMIADAQIASGKYFIVNNNLYLSTTTILAGDPIKPGTNCTLTNLAAALNTLNS